MRFLAVSDIHGKIAPVRQLRALESNRFDAVVIAGDIGQDLASATEVIGILGTFDCPVLYIYGNWDHSLTYDLKLAPNAHHLHTQCVPVGGYTFAGFSGLPTHWGANPYVGPIEDAVADRHGAELRDLAAEMARAQAVIDQAKAALAVSDAALAGERQRQLRTLWGRFGALRRREAQVKARHEQEWRATASAVIAANRRAMLERLSGYDLRRTVIVTHERLTNTRDDLPEVPLFLFGHRHGFKQTRMGPSSFVNVSALDQIIQVLPDGHSTTDWKLIRKGIRLANIGTYTVIEIDQSNGIRVTSQPLKIMPPGWQQFPGYPGRWLPLEQDTPDLSGICAP